jgi:hypothetical protein
MRVWSTSAPMCCLLLWREPFRLIRGLRVPEARWQYERSMRRTVSGFAEGAVTAK